MNSDWFDQSESEALAAVAEAEDANFSALVKTAGLDPALDLRHMPLQNIVVQPGEDLSGFDLSEAD